MFLFCYRDSFFFLILFHRHNQQPNGSLLVGPLTVADSGWLLCVATRDQDRERDHRYIYLSVSGKTPCGLGFTPVWCSVCETHFQCLLKDK